MVSAALWFAPYTLALVPCNENRAHATACNLQLEEILFHRRAPRIGSLSRRGSDLRVTGRAYAASRQSDHCEVPTLRATTLLQPQLSVGAQVHLFQLLLVAPT